MFQQLMWLPVDSELLASDNELLTADEHADDKEYVEDIYEVIRCLLETQPKA